MLLIPAIDLKDGHCVRLKQGDMDQATVFSEDPAEMARHWLAQGARRLHLVDLNGAFAGKPKNESAVKSIIKAVREFAIDNDVDEIPIQLGGGIRDLDTIERYLDDGLSYIIIGTAAVKNPGFLHDACSAFPGQIIVGLDAKDGKVATDGWSKMSGHEVIDLAKKFEDYGVRSDRLHRHRPRRHDGRRQHRSHRAAGAGSMTIPVIASGGVHNIKDVEALCAVQDEGIEGVICGRSIYEGTLDLRLAQAARRRT